MFCIIFLCHVSIVINFNNIQNLKFLIFVNDRSVIQKSPLVHLLINEECDIPFSFLVDLVTAAASDSDLFMQVKYCIIIKYF